MSLSTKGSNVPIIKKTPTKRSDRNKPAVAFVGSLNIDLYCYTNIIPRMSQTVVGNRFHISYGGRGGNACVMCAKMGGAAAMIGRVGADCFGKEYVIRMKKLNINISEVKLTDEAPTGVAQYTINEKSGKYYAVVVPNANFLLTPADVAHSKQMLKSIKVGVFTFEIPAETVLESMKIFKEAGVETIILAVSGVLDKIYFELATIIVLNELQLEEATGDEVKSIADAYFSLKKLLMKGCEIAIATLGAWGSLFINKSDPSTPIRVMVSPIDNPVDVTGSTDAFIGCLAYAIVYYKDLTFEEKVKIACEVARQTVQKYGSQDSYPFKNDVIDIFPEGKQQID